MPLIALLFPGLQAGVVTRLIELAHPTNKQIETGRKIPLVFLAGPDGVGINDDSLSVSKLGGYKNPPVVVAVTSEPFLQKCQELHVDDFWSVEVDVLRLIAKAIPAHI
jgi:hypothetical protein